MLRDDGLQPCMPINTIMKAFKNICTWTTSDQLNQTESVGVVPQKQLFKMVSR